MSEFKKDSKSFISYVRSGKIREEKLGKLTQKGLDRGGQLYLADITKSLGDEPKVKGEMHTELKKHVKGKGFEGFANDKQIKSCASDFFGEWLIGELRNEIREH